MQVTVTLVLIRRNEAKGEFFGFAINDQQEQFFLPRDTILLNDLRPWDIGKRGVFTAVPNPTPMDNKANHPHLIGKAEFETKRKKRNPT